MITRLFELYFRSRRFIFLIQTKKRILWTMAAAQPAENHEDEKTWPDIYNERNMHQFQLTKFSFSSKNTLFKAVFPWNISQMITKTVPISTRITISCAVKRCIHFWLWKKKKENGENSMIKISQRRKVHYIFANRPASRGTHTHFAQHPTVRPHRRNVPLFQKSFKIFPRHPVFPVSWRLQLQSFHLHSFLSI